jgi:hypothetical protein
MGKHRHHHKDSGSGDDKKNERKLRLLEPLMRPMKATLARKGIQYQDDIKDVAWKFYKHIVQGEQFIGQYSSDFVVTVIMIVATALPAIIKYFKNLKKKKDAGETLTPLEETAYTEAQTVANDKTINPDSGMGDFLSSNWIVIVAVLVVLYFLFKK